MDPDLFQCTIIRVNKGAKEIIKQGRKCMHSVIVLPHPFSDLVLNIF